MAAAEKKPNNRVQNTASLSCHRSFPLAVACSGTLRKRMKGRRKTRRIVIAIAGILLSILVAGFLLPGPIEGFWDPKLLACACDSRNLVEFRAGRAFVSSGHEGLRGEMGRYYKEEGSWIWETGSPENPSRTRLYPTWFLIRVEGGGLEKPLIGHRLLWPPAVAEARANLKPLVSTVEE
jgi:hypothetical protein